MTALKRGTLGVFYDLQCIGEQGLIKLPQGRILAGAIERSLLRRFSQKGNFCPDAVSDRVLIRRTQKGSPGINMTDKEVVIEAKWVKAIN
jgi:hypothetical protein